jgi:hypothetical protein
MKEVEKVLEDPIKKELDSPEEDYILCWHCKFKNDTEREYCKNCKRRLKQKKSIIPLLILLILIYPLFYIAIDNFGTYVSSQRQDYIDLPYSIIKEVNSSIPIERIDCKNRSFRFSTQGGNVDSVKSYVVPNLIINNLEERWGYFKVNFSYIPEKKYPYSVFGGINLKESLSSGKIGYDDADFYSENYYFYIGPGESILINNRTQKPDKTATYWGIANIIEPKVLECSKRTEYYILPENKTFTEYKKTLREYSVKEYKKIREVLGIKNFLDGFIIFILLILIIFLIIKIAERYDLVERYKRYRKARKNKEENEDRDK